MLSVLTWTMLLLLDPFLPHHVSCPANGKPGIWSNRAVYLCSRAAGTSFTRSIQIYSPDHRKTVDVNGEHWSVEIGGKKITGIPLAQSYVSFYPSELSWAPDSSAFYITQSDATSEINGFRTDVFLVESGVTKVPDVDQTVEAQFRRDHQCILRFPGGGHVDDTNFNVAGLAWIGQSDLLVMTVEIPPDSSCGPRGYFGGYAVDIRTQAIRGDYSPSELSKRWGGHFGQRLRTDYGNLTREQRARRP